MLNIDETLELIRRVHRKMTTAELARRADLPMMTVVDASKRGFVGGKVDTLAKLAAAAEAYEREHGGAK